VKKNEIKNRLIGVPFNRFAADALTPVEPEDLSRFEGEGGLEAPMPAAKLFDVPLENALWRRLHWAAHQHFKESNS
jgi:hypothetical protein